MVHAATTFKLRRGSRIDSNSHGPDTNALKAAVAWFLKQIAASPSRRGLLVVHGKGNLKGTTIETVLGSAAVKQLDKNNKVQFQGGTIELMTEKIKPYSWSGPILVVYSSPKLLDMVDSLEAASAILVVPWLRDEIEPWIQMWGARELGSTDEPLPKQFSNPTVRAALESLTARVNLSTGLVHPSDKAAAVKMFRLLNGAGEQFDLDEVRAWLISELNWEPSHANEVQDVAKGVLAGKKFRVSASGGLTTLWNGRGKVV